MNNRTKTQVVKIGIFLLINILVLLYLEYGISDAERYQKGLVAYQDQNFSKTYNIMSALAKKQHPGAENILATLYFKGQGVEVDKELATFWYEKAATDGSKEAQQFIQNSRLAVE